MNNGLENAKFEKKERAIEFDNVGIEEFRNTLLELPEEYKETLRILSLEEMSERKIRTFLSQTKLSGFAIDDKYIMNVFSRKEEKGGGSEAIRQVIKNGGNWLKCKDRKPGERWGLPDYYRNLGFEEFKRIKYNNKRDTILIRLIK